jgi:hypothetical protein
MPVTREMAACSLVIYNDGEGDPIVTDHGFGAHDDLDENRLFGVYSLDALNRPLCKWHDHVGLRNRIFLVPKDTRQADWTTTTSGGLYTNSWEERRPTDGLYRVYRLSQFDASPGVQWTATSKFNVPPDPNFVISVILSNIPSDWDYLNLNPYWMIELGNGLYGLLFAHGGEGYFLRKNTNTGKWVMAGRVGHPQKHEGLDESFLSIECGNGRILVSGSLGEHYEPFGDDLNPLHIPSGPIRLSGQGGKFTFGYMQAAYYQAVYSNSPWNTFFSHAPNAPIITGRYDTPQSSSVVFNDVSQGINAQYTATLNPGSFAMTPWPMMFSPTLGNVTFRYPVVRQIMANGSTTPVDAYIMEATVKKPKKRDAATATIILQKNQQTTYLFTGNWKLRKMQLKLGYLLSDSTYEWYTSFTGYVDEIKDQWEQFGQNTITIELHNGTYRFKTTTWNELDVISLGGVVPNYSSDYVLYTEGLMDAARTDASYRNWYYTGDLNQNILPVGTNDQPSELIKPEEDKWETITRLQAHIGLEAGCDDNGVLYSVPFNYVEPTVTWNFRATSQSSTDLRDQIKTISQVFKSTDTVTMVFSTGELPNGTKGMAWISDNLAEFNVASGRFSRWRLVLHDRVKGIISAGLLFARAQFLAGINFGRSWRPDVVTAVNPALRLGQRIAVWGCATINIPDGTEHVVETLTHTYKSQQGIGTLSSSAGLRRL